MRTLTNSFEYLDNLSQSHKLALNESRPDFAKSIMKEIKSYLKSKYVFLQAVGIENDPNLSDYVSLVDGASIYFFKEDLTVGTNQTNNYNVRTNNPATGEVTLYKVESNILDRETILDILFLSGMEYGVTNLAGSSDMIKIESVNL